tara:strand:- start:141 stop:359 length:219 start_codon:yes stop_codon:yes gene_type:complete
MNKDQYLEIRNNHERDTHPVYHFYFNLKGGTRMPETVFFQLFWKWVMWRVGMNNLGAIQYKVFKELDEHFKV